MKTYKYSLISILVIFLFSFHLKAEDIELYVGNEVQRAATNPQVLIIFDNSGSMKTLETYELDYSGTSALNNDDWIYYTTDPKNNMVTLSENKRKFKASKLGCFNAREILKQYGTYSGKFRKYQDNKILKNNKKGWQNLNADGYSNLGLVSTVDCLEDIQKSIASNASGYDNGYPRSKDSANGYNPYTTTTSKIDLTKFQKSTAVTLYTKEYLKFMQDNNQGLSRSRIEIAKETIIRLIETSTHVDYGLMIFNTNNGGRIVYDVADMSEGTNQADYINTVNSLSATTNTPLCETLSEAMRYYGGESVYFGGSSGNYTTPNSLYRSGHYSSPYANCSNEIYTIMITDGAPTNDTDRNSWLRQNLSGFDTSKAIDGNYLPALSHWMANNDINEDIQGEQHSTLYTIGFGQSAIDDAGVLLKTAAENGGGEYYAATNATELLTSLQSALLEILQLDTSFTAPSIASNNYDRTETLDSVYYAMFLPDNGSRWRGNLKKLKLSNNQQLDKDDKVAIDSTGNIMSNAKTYWSNNNGKSDGNDVTQGGVSETLQNATSRLIYSDIGSDDEFELLTEINAIAAFSNAQALADILEVTTGEISEMLDWAKGVDVDDEDADGNITEHRESIFGDPLHFKPIVINYGGSLTEQDVRIVVGTNSGVLHMLEDEGESVKENWAFMPKEFFSQYSDLRSSNEETTKNYSVDGLATVYQYDANGDGAIRAIDNDKAWLFFGLRRGGYSYYAIDVTNPDSPSFMWKISSEDVGFKSMGQTWSKMKVGYSKANIVNGIAEPVLFFSGGYDEQKDSAVVGKSDDLGKGFYMVDAKTGTLIWSLTSDDTTAKNKQFVGITDSIVASPSLLDSDSDGMVDRIYLPDTGGNIWRIDMPGADPSSSSKPWTYYKFASVGGDSQISDRRFMNEAVIARTYFEVTETTKVDDGTGSVSSEVIRYKIPYESIVLGSGDRSNPQSSDNQDRLYMFKDENILTQSFQGESIPTTIDGDSLANFTNNPYGEQLSKSQKETLDLAVSAASGWYIDLTRDGEKSLSSASVIAGVAYFTSFSPSVDVDVESCELSTGQGLLYAVNLEYGINVYEWRTLNIGDRVPDTPTLVVPATNVAPNKMKFIGVGHGDGEGVLTLCDGNGCNENSSGISLKTLRTYLYLDENN